MARFRRASPQKRKNQLRRAREYSKAYTGRNEHVNRPSAGNSFHRPGAPARFSNTSSRHKGLTTASSNTVIRSYPKYDSSWDENRLGRNWEESPHQSEEALQKSVLIESPEHSIRARSFPHPYSSLSDADRCLDHLAHEEPPPRRCWNCDLDLICSGPGCEKSWKLLNRKREILNYSRAYDFSSIMMFWKDANVKFYADSNIPKLQKLQLRIASYISASQTFEVVNQSASEEPQHSQLVHRLSKIKYETECQEIRHRSQETWPSWFTPAAVQDRRLSYCMTVGLVDKLQGLDGFGFAVFSTTRFGSPADLHIWCYPHYHAFHYHFKTSNPSKSSEVSLSYSEDRLSNDLWTQSLLSPPALFAPRQEMGFPVYLHLWCETKSSELSPTQFAPGQEMGFPKFLHLWCETKSPKLSPARSEAEFGMMLGMSGERLAELHLIIYRRYGTGTIDLSNVREFLDEFILRRHPILLGEVSHDIGVGVESSGVKSHEDSGNYGGAEGLDIDKYRWLRMPRRLVGLFVPTIGTQSKWNRHHQNLSFNTQRCPRRKLRIFQHRTVREEITNLDAQSAVITEFKDTSFQDDRILSHNDCFNLTAWKLGAGESKSWKSSKFMKGSRRRIPFNKPVAWFGFGCRSTVIKIPRYLLVSEGVRVKHPLRADSKSHCKHRHYGKFSRGDEIEDDKSSHENDIRDRDLHQDRKNIDCPVIVSPPPRNLKNLFPTNENKWLGSILAYFQPGYDCFGNIYLPPHYKLYQLERNGEHIKVFSATNFNTLHGEEEYHITCFLHLFNLMADTRQEAKRPSVKNYQIRLVKRLQKSRSYHDTVVHAGLLWIIQRETISYPCSEPLSSIDNGICWRPERQSRWQRRTTKTLTASNVLPKRGSEMFKTEFPRLPKASEKEKQQRNRREIDSGLRIPQSSEAKADKKRAAQRQRRIRKRAEHKSQKAIENVVNESYGVDP